MCLERVLEARSAFAECPTQPAPARSRAERKRSYPDSDPRPYPANGCSRRCRAANSPPTSLIFEECAQAAAQGIERCHALHPEDQRRMAGLLTVDWLRKALERCGSRERLDEQLHERRRQNGGVRAEVVACAERVLDIAAEHPESEHVQQQVRRIGMQERRGYELPNVKADRRADVGRKETADRPERKARDERVAEDDLEPEYDDVDDDQATCERSHLTSAGGFAEANDTLREHRL